MNGQNAIIYLAGKALMAYGAYVLTTKYILPRIPQPAPTTPSYKSSGIFVK